MLRKRIDVARTYVEAKGGEKSAENRELGEIVESDNHNFEFVRLSRCHANLNQPIFVQRGSHLDVCGDDFRNKGGVVVLRHSAEEIFEKLPAYCRTKGLNRLF